MMDCRFCDEALHGGVAQATHLAPQTEPNGTLAGYQPACPFHLDGWFDDVPEEDRRPLIPIPKGN
jgi:hypothetical protein